MSSADIADKILSEISSEERDIQNEVIEALVRKVSTGRDREAQDLEHRAMLIRNANNDLRNRLVYLNHKSS